MAKQDVELQFRLIDGVTKSLTAIQQGVSGLGASLVKLNSAADLAGKGIDLVVSAAKGIGGAVAGAADFEEAMRRISIRTNATADEQVALQQAVIAAADSIGATADQSAAALFALAKDGGTATQAIDSLGAVLAYAKLQGGEAADSAAALGGILDSFGPRAGTVGQVADALTSVAAAAGTEAKTLEAALGGLGVAAQQANLSFNDTVAILGQLATRNIEGADASKRLATILDQFQDPASKAGKALADAGLAGADFSTILQTLSSDSEAATLVLDSLGRKPQEALTALLDGGGGALSKFNGIVNDTAGSTAKAAAALDGTFNDSLRRVQAQISILSEVAAGPILKPLADGLAVVAGKLSEFAKSPAFNEIIKQITKFAADAADDLVKFVEAFNFDAAASAIQDFVTVCGVAFDAIVIAAKAAALTIDAVRISYAALPKPGDVKGAIDGASQAIDDVTVKLDNLTVSSYAATAGWQNLEPVVTKAGESAQRSAQYYRELALSLVPEPARIVAEALIAAGDAAIEFGGKVGTGASAQKGLQDALTETFVKLQQAQEAYAKAFADGKGADAAWADVVRLSNAVADLRKQLDSTKTSTIELTGSFKELGIKSQQALVESAQKGAEAFRAVADAARQGQATQDDVTRAFEVYAQRLAETATLADSTTKAQIAQQIQLAGHVAGVSRAVIDVATQTLKSADVAESSNARSSAAWDKTAASVAGLAKDIDQAAKSTSSFADSARDIGNVSSALDRVSESATTSGFQISNLSGKLLEISLNAVQAGTDGAMVSQSFNFVADAARRANQAIDEQIRKIEALNPVLREEAKIRADIEQRYGVSGDRVERLVQLRLQENEARRRTIELAQREIEQADTQIAQTNQQIALAGGFGASRSNPAATPTGATAASAPASAAASKGVSQAVTINIQGLPSDRAGWRQAVEEFVLPEIQRLGKLSR